MPKAEIKPLRPYTRRVEYTHDPGSLLQSPQSEENVMPAIVDAVRAYGTIGEIADVLRSVWGTYEEERSVL